MATAHVATLSAARKELQAKEFDLVLADLRLPDGSSMELLKWMKGKHYSIPFLIMTSYGQVENAVEAMQLGASNYLCKPVHPDRFWEVIEKSSAVRSMAARNSTVVKVKRPVRCTG